MSFPTDNILLGPHTYGKRPKTYGVVLHTTEGAGPTMQDAKNTVRLQSPGGSLWAGGGSYNFILTNDGPLLTVPYQEASGGLSGDHNPAWWRPDRFPWLKQSLAPEAYADPNLYMLQLSVSGKTAQLQSYPEIQRIADDAARIIKWAEESDWAEDNLVVSGHFNWQTDRSDPSQWFIDLVMDKYSQLGQAPAPGPTGNFIGTFAAEEWTDARGDLVRTVAESADRKSRLVKLPDNRLQWVSRGSLTPKVPGGDVDYRVSVLNALERRTPDPDQRWLDWLATAPKKG